jgi:Flp pilus assembly protein TadD
MFRRLVIMLFCLSYLAAGEDPLRAPLDLKLFAQRAIAPDTTKIASSQRNQLQLLVNSIHKPIEEGGLGIQYDNSYTRTVEEVWRDRKANCLSLTALYVSCARSLGYHATYAESMNTQRWRRVGNVIRYERHVVALVRDFPNIDMVADFLPQLRKRWGTYIVTTIPETRFRALFHSNRAVEMMGFGDLPAALEQANMSVKVDPASSVGWNIRGVVYRNLENMVEAEKCYRKAHQLDPKDTSCIGNLEALTREQGRMAESTKFREMGLELRQKDPYFQAFLAEEALANADLVEAARKIQIALKVQPYEPEFHLLSARIQLASGKLDEAMKTIQEARRWAQPKERERYDSKLNLLKKQAAADAPAQVPPADPKVGSPAP